MKILLAAVAVAMAFPAVLAAPLDVSVAMSPTHFTALPNQQNAVLYVHGMPGENHDAFAQVWCESNGEDDIQTSTTIVNGVTVPHDTRLRPSPVLGDPKACATEIAP